MDLATVSGIAISFLLVFLAIFSGGRLSLFLDPHSALIVFGGTVGATLVNYPLKQALGVLLVVKNAFLTKSEDPMRLVALFKDFAHKARRNGILALEPEIDGIDDPFLRKGMQLTVDGLEPQVIQDILETEIASTEDRHERGAEILAAAGAYAPALGMIGTLIGLIQMLQTMNDPSTIGPSMSLALVATFYGAVLANLLFIPMSGKLKRRSREEILLKEMMLEGALAISKGENPRIIEEKLTAFIPARNR